MTNLKKIEKLIEEYVETQTTIQGNKNSLKKLTTNEGLYLFITKSRNNKDEVVYVGESINLKGRVNINHSVFKYLIDKNINFNIRTYTVKNKTISTKLLESLVLNHLYYELDFYPMLNKEI